MATSKRAEKIHRVAAARQWGAVVLEDVHDPHNAAAVFRSCDAFGIQSVHLVFVHERPYNPRRIGKQSSSSANKWLDFTVHASTESCLQWLHDEGYETIATVVGGHGESIFDAHFPNPRTAFLIGNEHRGLSPAAVQIARRRLSIPMVGMVESLNLSVTASICLFELARQRSHANTAEFRLPQEKMVQLEADFLARSRKGPTVRRTSGA